MVSTQRLFHSQWRSGFFFSFFFLEFPCFFYDPMDVANLISGSFAVSKSILYIWKFSVHVLLKPSWKDFEHNFASMWNECNCMEIWTSLALPFFGIGMKTDLFQSCGHCCFPNLLTYWVQHFHSTLPLSPCLSPLFFSELFVSLSQTTILSFCICFSWRWLWSPYPVQC